MSDINWKDGAVCYANCEQWFAYTEIKLALHDDYGKSNHIHSLVQLNDFQLNQPRIGDYIEKSELDTEQKYNDAVEVFGLFGIICDSLSEFSGIDSGEFEYGFALELQAVAGVGYSNVNGGLDCKRKLTYNQLIAIGKLKRLMDGKSNKNVAYTITKGIQRKDGYEDFELCGVDSGGLAGVISVSFNDENEICKVRLLDSRKESTPKTTPEVSADKSKTSVEYLNECIEVQKQRGEQYDSAGTGERSFSAAAQAYNAITGRDLKGSDVCLMLEMVKNVRQYSDPSRLHEDSVLDKVSYSSLWAEELNKELK